MTEPFPPTPSPPGEPEDQPERTQFAEPPPEPAVVPAPAPVASAEVVPPDAEPERTLPQEPPLASAEPQEPPLASAEVVPPDAEPERTHAGGLTRALVVLAVLLLLAVGVLSWQLVALSDRPNADYQREAKAALAAAKADAVLVLAYDYRTLEAGFQKALKVTVDADGPSCAQKADRTSPSYDPKANCFRSEYTLTHQKVVTDLATRFRAVVIAEVSAGAVEKVAGDQVTVLLYVNQQSTNTQSASPKITQDRVEMIMQKVRGRWLVAGINAL